MNFSTVIIPAKTKKFLLENNLINPSSTKFFDYFVSVAPSSLILLVKALTSRNNYTRLIESENFLLRASKALGQADYRRFRKFLRVAIALVGKELPKDFRTFVYAEFLKVVCKPEEHKAISIKIINKICKLEPEDKQISPDTWYYLSKSLNMLGFTVAGFYARERSLTSRQTEVSDDFSDSRSIELRLASHLEVKNEIESAQIIKKFAEKIHPLRRYHFQFYLNLISGADIDSLSCNRDVAVSKLHNLISGKNVVLIGPGAPCGDFGHEIDSSDVVVRVKYAGTDFLPSGKLHGSRCDIASFNNLSSFLLLIDDGVEVEILKGLKAVLTCKRSTAETIQGVPVVYIDGLRSAYPNGGLTAGITTLVNLVRCSPARLKLFGFDFYTEEQVYDSTLSDFYQSDSWVIGWPPYLGNDNVNSFANRSSSHFREDQICNFALAQNLYNFGAFEIDDRGSMILSMSRERYAERIEYILSNILERNAPLI